MWPYTGFVTLRRCCVYHTVSVWSLDNNQLSSNMKSQLRRIQQYKRDGSNGYQQVEGMEIRTL